MREAWPKNLMSSLAALLAPDANGLPKIRFRKGTAVAKKFGTKELVICGGAIARARDYESGDCSLCHLTQNGAIWSHGERVGSVDDIEWLTIDDGTWKSDENWP